MTANPPGLITPTPTRAWLPVWLAATVNVPLSACPAAINGVLLGPAPSRVLLTGQTTPAENGIYRPQESGAATDRNIAANQSTTENATADLLVWVSATGTVTVTGANGSVTGGQSGFLAPLSGPSRFTITGGASGGVASFKPTVALVRTDDADANGDFLSSKMVEVQRGTNAGIWNLLGPVSPLVLTNSLPIQFFRTVEGNVVRPAHDAAFTSDAPGVKPVGIAFALITSLGPLAVSTGEALHSLI